MVGLSQGGVLTGGGISAGVGGRASPLSASPSPRLLLSSGQYTEGRSLATGGGKLSTGPSLLVFFFKEFSFVCIVCASLSGMAGVSFLHGLGIFFCSFTPESCGLSTGVVGAAGKTPIDASAVASVGSLVLLRHDSISASHSRKACIHPLICSMVLRR